MLQAFFLTGLVSLAMSTAQAQDPVQVDPEHYKVELENGQIRALRVHYGPHEKGVMHESTPAVLVCLTDSHVRLTLPDGKTEESQRKAGDVVWITQEKHIMENLEDKPFEAIYVELKSKPATAELETTESNGKQSAAVEVLTPTEGVDFRNYLARFLATVKKNWYALMPQLARRGEKGRVAVQFHILRDGKIPNTEPVLINSSTKQPLDRAAIGAIRASAPFEPLPSAFNGPSIELRLTFLYNLPPR